MNKKLRILAIAALVLSLTSCIEVFQYVSITDGDVSIYLKYVIQKAILEIGASFSGEEMDYDEFLGEGEDIFADLGNLRAGMRPINTELEVGYEVDIEGTLEEIRLLSESESVPFVPRAVGDSYYLTIPGMGSSSSDDDMGAAFLASSKYRILVDLSGDLSNIRNARVIFDGDDDELDAAGDSLITSTVLGQTLLVEMSMLIPFMSEEEISVELF
jgi:hypothetical protein